MRTVLAVLLIALTGCDTRTPEPAPPAAPMAPIPVVGSATHVVVAGTLRQSRDNPAQWLYIIDDAHGAAGVDGHYALASGDRLTIRFAERYAKILTFLVVPDETFAQQGYAFGASVTRERAVIRSNAGILDGSDGRALDNGNIWFYGVFERSGQPVH